MIREEASAAAPAPATPSPRGEVGVLLVHGIGDHKEGETLTSFGEPLVDWMREWLRARGGVNQHGEAAVPSARLRATRTEAESPAFAELDLRAPARAGGAAATEKWLLCEAWWGGSVQPPPSLTLLRWMWSRGPLLIYWHIFVGLKRGDDPPEPLVVAFSLFAFVLAGMCQLLISLAILLWLVPFGPWRRAVVAAVRALTLTLGDSYVLLEQDIQRGALVQRVRKSLGWLEDRVERIVVIAHSQGGAIAHEALRSRGAGKVRMFLSVGSGLEKLQFLRAVRERRRGLLSTALIFPAAVLGVTVLINGWLADEPPMTFVGAALLFLMLGLGVQLSVALDGYRELLLQRLPESALTGMRRRRWLDLYASHDVVPMGRRSVFTGAPFLVRAEIFNERSFIHDHTGYFDNRGSFLSAAWQAMSRLSALRLFFPGERALLWRHTLVHGHYARALAASHLAIMLAAVVLAVVMRNELVGFGAALLQNIQGPMAEALKPVRALARVIASVIERVLPGLADENTVTDAFFGGAVLFGAIVLWWVCFKGFWRARCVTRWRRACRRVDILQTRASRFAHAVGCALFTAAGFMPLLVAVLLAFTPEALSARAISDTSAAALGVLILLIGIGYLAGGPWIARELWRDKDSSRWLRYGAPAWVAVFAGVVFVVAFWMWPPLKQQGWIVVAGYAVAALAWHVYTVVNLRHELGGMGLICALVLPAGATLVSAHFESSLALRDLAAVWFLLTLATLGVVLLVVRWDRITAEITAAMREFAARLRRFWPH